MAKLTNVYRQNEIPEIEIGNRQLPLAAGENNLMMLMDLNSRGLIFDHQYVRGKTLDEFTRKYKILSESELKKSLEVTYGEFSAILSQGVPCIGCRRSVERLYKQLMKSGYATLDPLFITPAGLLTVTNERMKSTHGICNILHQHNILLNKYLETQPRNKKSSRCGLHSLDSFRTRPFSDMWRDVWNCMKPQCRDEIAHIDAEELHATLEVYLKKHKFCQECRTKVDKAYGLLVNESNPSKEKGYVASLYSNIKKCIADKHIHVQTRTDFIDSLIKRAEPELNGSNTRNRERHAKTLEIAQEEVLTCIGMCIYERLRRVHVTLREEENACQVLAAVGVDALGRSFDLAVEEKQGISNLELLYQEIKRDEKMKEIRKEQKKQKKKKKKNEKKNLSSRCLNSDSGIDEHSSSETTILTTNGSATTPSPPPITSTLWDCVINEDEYFCYDEDDLDEEDEDDDDEVDDEEELEEEEAEVEEIDICCGSSDGSSGICTESRDSGGGGSGGSSSCIKSDNIFNGLMKSNGHDNDIMVTVGKRSLVKKQDKLCNNSDRCCNNCNNLTPGNNSNRKNRKISNDNCKNEKFSRCKKAYEKNGKIINNGCTKSIDGGYVSEPSSHHEELCSMVLSNNNSRTSSIVSTPEGSEVACSDGCCNHHDQIQFSAANKNEKKHNNNRCKATSDCTKDIEHIGKLLTLEQMLNVTPDERETVNVIPDEVVMDFKCRENSINKLREELRMKLRSNFAQLCVKTRTPATTPTPTPTAMAKKVCNK